MPSMVTASIAPYTTFSATWGRHCMSRVGLSQKRMSLRNSFTSQTVVMRAITHCKYTPLSLGFGGLWPFSSCRFFSCFPFPSSMFVCFHFHTVFLVTSFAHLNCSFVPLPYLPDVGFCKECQPGCECKGSPCFHESTFKGGIPDFMDT